MHRCVSALSGRDEYNGQRWGVSKTEKKRHGDEECEKKKASEMWNRKGWRGKEKVAFRALRRSVKPGSRSRDRNAPRFARHLSEKRANQRRSFGYAQRVQVVPLSRVNIAGDSVSAPRFTKYDRVSHLIAAVLFSRSLPSLIPSLSYSFLRVLILSLSHSFRHSFFLSLSHSGTLFSSLALPPQSSSFFLNPLPVRVYNQLLFFFLLFFFSCCYLLSFLRFHLACVYARARLLIFVAARLYAFLVSTRAGRTLTPRPPPPPPINLTHNGF